MVEALKHTGPMHARCLSCDQIAAVRACTPQKVQVQPTLRFPTSWWVANSLGAFVGATAFTKGGKLPRQYASMWAPALRIPLVRFLRAPTCSTNLCGRSASTTRSGSACLDASSTLRFPSQRERVTSEGPVPSASALERLEWALAFHKICCERRRPRNQPTILQVVGDAAPHVGVERSGSGLPLGHATPHGPQGAEAISNVNKRV